MASRWGNLGGGRTAPGLSRRALLAGGGGAAAAVLAACGAPGPAGGAGPAAGAPSATAGPAHLQLWYQLTGAQADHLNRVNARFTAEHPGVEVELLTVPESDMTAKLAAAVAGGRPPDMTTLGGMTRVTELIDNKKVVSLSRFRRDLARLDWYDSLKQPVVRGDDLFAMPTQASTLALYYNADLYAKAGLDPDAPPATWEALLANARAIARPEQQLWGHYVATKPITWTADLVWVAYLWQAGGEWLSRDGKRAAFNGPAGVEALQFWADLVQKYQVAPQKAVDNLVMGQDFETGTVGHMTIYAGWAIREEGMKFPVRTAPLPRHAQPATVAAGLIIPIFAESKQQDAAWAYLDWLSQPDHLIYYLSGSGALPPRRSIAEAAAWTAFTAQHPLVQTFVDVLRQARLPYYGKGAEEISVQVAQAIEAAVYGQKTPKQALDDAAQQANAILARA
jgi:ABC-type glycerol-3-phosphate transport system substrate-binding protein